MKIEPCKCGTPPNYWIQLTRGTNPVYWIECPCCHTYSDEAFELQDAIINWQVLVTGAIHPERKHNNYGYREMF